MYVYISITDRSCSAVCTRIYQYPSIEKYIPRGRMPPLFLFYLSHFLSSSSVVHAAVYIYLHATYIYTHIRREKAVRKGLFVYNVKYVVHRIKKEENNLLHCSIMQERKISGIISKYMMKICKKKKKKNQHFLSESFSPFFSSFHFPSSLLSPYQILAYRKIIMIFNLALTFLTRCSRTCLLKS